MQDDDTKTTDAAASEKAKPAADTAAESLPQAPTLAAPGSPLQAPLPAPADVTPEALASAISQMMAESDAAVADPAPAADDFDAGPPRGATVAQIGVLLVNLGTPDAADAKSVRIYLKEFLSDPRVIEKNSVAWKLLLNGLILRIRPQLKARAYRKIWNKEQNESPLKTITRAQAERLAEMLGRIDQRIVVDWAMRYGNPSIRSRIDALTKQGCDRILVMPLYPQYSAATNATVVDEVFRKLARMRAQPAIRILPPYYDDPSYIEALNASIRLGLGRLDFEPEVILASFHGMPKEYVAKGDPYERHCMRTVELLRHRLGRGEKELQLSFQSRFGRDEWLQPYTDATVKALAKQGVKRLAVITPGFAADCLETLEEIALENGHLFHKRGGEKFAALPCLNDNQFGMDMLRTLALRELKGWVDVPQ